MTAEEFQKFVKAADHVYGASQLRLANALGCSKNSITRWSRHGAPFYIDLAAAAIMEGLKPFSKTA